MSLVLQALAAVLQPLFSTTYKILHKHKVKHLFQASQHWHILTMETIGNKTCGVRPLNKFLVIYNSTTEHNTTKLITPFHSESTAQSNDINI